jgi:hypothetical protein
VLLLGRIYLDALNLVLRSKRSNHNPFVDWESHYKASSAETWSRLLAMLGPAEVTGQRLDDVLSDSASLDEWVRPDASRPRITRDRCSMNCLIGHAPENIPPSAPSTPAPLEPILPKPLSHDRINIDTRALDEASQQSHAAATVLTVRSELGA